MYSRMRACCATTKCVTNNRNERRNERTLSCSIHAATGVRLWQRAFTCAGSSIYQQCGAACVSSAWFVPWPSWARCVWLGFIVHVKRFKHLKTLTIPMNCLGQTFWTSQLYPSPPMGIWSLPKFLCRISLHNGAAVANEACRYKMQLKCIFSEIGLCILQVTVFSCR